MQNDTATRPQYGAEKFKISSLPFSQIPHQSKLFLDYLNSDTSLERFYPNRTSSVDELRGFAATVLGSYRTDRNRLSNALDRINQSAAAGPKTFSNIELLRHHGTVAVVTGQQAGLFTGPAYTIYKALTAIKVASQLSSIGTPAVPVFWVASEDHDFEEVSATLLKGNSGDLVRAEHRPTQYADGLPVGSVVAEAEITTELSRLFDNLGNSYFSDELRSHLLEAWKPGTTYSTAFLRDLAYLFKEHGLILLDPMDPELKQLSSPIYRLAIERSEDLVQAVVEQGFALRSAGYEPQVLVEDDYSPFFLIDESGKRRALKKWRGNYRERLSGVEYTLSDLSHLAASEPERLSPGVILRPLVQDHLLPTVCYVGGGAEIAYFAQNSGAYEVLDRPVTPIMHRQSFTIIEPAQARQLGKLGLNFSDLFGGRPAVTDRIARENEPSASGRLFADVEERINSELSRIDQHLAGIDPTLAAAFAKRRRKIIYHIAATHSRTRLAEARANELIGIRLDRLFNALWPSDALQERTVNGFSFIHEYGLQFIDWLFEACDLNDRSHRILEIK